MKNIPTARPVVYQVMAGGHPEHLKYIALAVMSRPEYQAASEEEKKQMILDACEYAGRHEDEINHIQLWRDLITPLIPEAVLQDSDFEQ